MERSRDIIVIGGGHAGCEAALAAASLGVNTLLITTDITKLGVMSCNPSIGGIGKGQIVREIDALGGFTAQCTDLTTLQFRMLNRSKGAAMHSPRAQCDRDLFSLTWRRKLEGATNLAIIQDTIEELLLEEHEGKTLCVGVRSKLGGDIVAQRVILTAGTFLNGLIHVGMYHTPGGRIDESAVPRLTAQLVAHGVKAARFKTGTSPRIDLRTIDLDVCRIQAGDIEGGHFSYSITCPSPLPQRPCYITETNPETHAILRANLNRSPLFQHVIQGRGPRYCPSIEDKIHIFADKGSHPIFLEPENSEGNTVYINGFSTSLPYDVQEVGLHSIRGLEEAHIIRPGYAIEYDYFDPLQLEHSLASKVIGGLYIAGQLNGTTGYEEAAAQGLLAGINAAHTLLGRTPIVLRRSEAYIGVMIDDLVTKGVDEPYRMFTSRAEHRLSLREDNADERLYQLSVAIGLRSKEALEKTATKYETVTALAHYLTQLSLTPEMVNEYLLAQGGTPLPQAIKAHKLLLRPEVKLASLLPHIPTTAFDKNTLSAEIVQSAETRIKYASYIEKEEQESEQTLKIDTIHIPDTLDYTTLESISIEGRQKLRQHRPKTLGEAKQIPGIKPSDLKAILIAMRSFVPRGTMEGTEDK